MFEDSQENPSDVSDFSESEIYRPSADLVAMGQGEEGVWFDREFPDPLYFSRGRAAVAEFLESAKHGVRPCEISDPDRRVLGELLIRHGILLPSSGARRSMRIENPGAPDRIYCYLLLSQYCNLSCVYCFNGDETYARASHRNMEEEVAFRAVDSFLEQLAPQGVLNVIFFGGEPLLNWNLARRVLERYGNREWPDGRKITFHLTSNLLKFPDSLVEDIQKYGITILCDVDGPPEIHDRLRPGPNRRPSHATIVSHLRKLAENGISYSLRATVTSVNVRAIPEIIRHHMDLGGNVSSLVAVNPVTSDETVLSRDLLPGAEEFADALLEAFRARIVPPDKLFPINQMRSTFQKGGAMRYPCGAPQGTTPAVDANGDIYPCIYFVGISRLKWGNVFRPGELYRSPLLAELQKATCPDEIEECRVCDWKYFCGAGCPVKRVLIDRNPRADEFIQRYCREVTCLPARKLFPELLWEYAREGRNRARAEEADNVRFE